MSMKLLLRDATEHGRKKAEYDGTSFLPVWEYIAKIVATRYGKKLQPSDLQDMISYITTRILDYWFERYDSNLSAPTTYALRGILNNVAPFFRQHERDRMIFQPPEGTPDSVAYMDTIPAPEEREPEYDQLTIQRIREYMLSHLNPTGKRIYPLWADGLTYEQIGAEVGLTKSRVGQYVTKFRALAGRYREIFLKEIP